MDYLAKSTSPASSFFFQPVTEAEVRLAILSIPNGKSHGFYSCPTQTLKHAHQYLSELLALFIYTSVFQGAYPAKLKLSKVVPVFRADDAFDANNYKSISLLSNFNRTFKKLIYSHMLSYINIMIFCVQGSMDSVKKTLYPAYKEIWIDSYTLAGSL